MLVLTRKLQEQILIGQDITITVLRIKGNTVRIGIDAPHDVRVVRGELPRYDTPGAAAGDLPQGNRPPTGHQRPAKPQDRAPDVQTRVSGLKPMVERVGQRCREARTQSVRVPTATALMD